ncbi:isochorismatase family cysteine hydrolase [Paenibacillus sp. FSL H8-0537]|uniref:cysteine hydrolase family protein n=1 Tax=Paenibacillus sp. FSL H8-0537 TaxID=2921399 RepID=UPI00310177AA
MSHYTEPNWMRSALITIDIQNDNSLPGSKAEVPGTAAILPTMKQLVEAYRRAKQPIIHVIRLYKADGSNVDLCRREIVENGFHFVVPNTTGADLVSEIKPADSPVLNGDLLLNGQFQQLGEYDWVMYKPRWGAFYQTYLEEFLVQKGIDTLIFAGCNFPNCPRTSMYEASERDFKVVMTVDAISGIYNKGIEEIISIGVSAIKSSDVLKNLNAIHGSIE